MLIQTEKEGKKRRKQGFYYNALTFKCLSIQKKKEKEVENKAFSIML
jgi:hypothetical protein